MTQDLSEKEEAEGMPDMPYFRAIMEERQRFIRDLCTNTVGIICDGNGRAYYMSDIQKAANGEFEPHKSHFEFSVMKTIEWQINRAINHAREEGRRAGYQAGRADLVREFAEKYPTASQTALDLQKLAGKK